VIRPYTTGFDPSSGYDIRHAAQWSPARKAAITRYYNLVKSFATKPHYTYRPRKKENLKAVKRAMSADKYNKLKVGFIQIPTSFNEAGEVVQEKPDIRINKHGQVKVKIKNVHRDPILFDDYNYDEADFIEVPDQFVSEMLSDTDYRFYSIMAGEHEAGQGGGVVSYYTKKELPGAVRALMEKYSADNHNENDPSSHFYGNWLRGFIGYNFDNINEYREYATAQTEYKKFFMDNKETIRKLNGRVSYYQDRIKKLNRKRKISDKEKRKLLNQYSNKINNSQKEINNLILKRIKS